MYDRGSGGSIPTVPSPFVRELRPSLYREFQETYTGALVEKAQNGQAAMQGRMDRKPPQPAAPHSGIAGSGFLDGLPEDMAARAAAILERGMAGTPRPRRAFRGDPDFADSLQETGGSAASPGPAQDEEHAPSLGEGPPAARTPASLGFCRHRVFGRGKIVQFLPPDKYRVNFPGLGLKVIMGAYLTMEE